MAFVGHCESSSPASACSSPAALRLAVPGAAGQSGQTGRLGAHGVDVIHQPAQLAAAAEQPAGPQDARLAGVGGNHDPLVEGNDVIDGMAQAVGGFRRPTLPGNLV